MSDLGHQAEAVEWARRCKSLMWKQDNICPTRYEVEECGTVIKHNGKLLAKCHDGVECYRLLAHLLFLERELHLLGFRK